MLGIYLIVQNKSRLLSTREYLLKIMMIFLIESLSKWVNLSEVFYHIIIIVFPFLIFIIFQSERERKERKTGRKKER